ncbi:MAG: hypothetical protein ACP5N1_05720 [Candidatus Woesearchaeota archaeon]
MENLTPKTLHINLEGDVIYNKIIITYTSSTKKTEVMYSALEDITAIRSGALILPDGVILIGNNSITDAILKHNFRDNSLANVVDVVSIQSETIRQNPHSDNVDFLNILYQIAMSKMNLHSLTSLDRIVVEDNVILSTYKDSSNYSRSKIRDKIMSNSVRTLERNNRNNYSNILPTFSRYRKNYLARYNI